MLVTDPHRAVVMLRGGHAAHAAALAIEHRIVRGGEPRPFTDGVGREADHPLAVAVVEAADRYLAAGAEKQRGQVAFEEGVLERVGAHQPHFPSAPTLDLAQRLHETRPHRLLHPAQYATNRRISCPRALDAAQLASHSDPGDAGMMLPARFTTLGFVLWGLQASCAAPAHPRLAFDAAGLARLRTVLAQTAPGVYGFAPADGWAAVQARAEALLAAPVYHYTVQIPAANGEHEGWKWSYTLSADPPPRHDESPHYPPWTAMFQERSDSITTRLKHFSLAYAVTGEAKYLAAAKDIALKLSAWPTWTDPSYGSQLSACLDTGHATQTVALFYDWSWDALAADERATIRTALIERGILPIRDQLTRLDPYHNFWAVINTGFGTAALALLGEDERAAGWVQEAIANTVRQFDRQGADGGSFEGPMYGTYAADMLAQLLFALDSAKVPHTLREHPFLATLPRFASTVSRRTSKASGLRRRRLGAGFPITRPPWRRWGEAARGIWSRPATQRAGHDRRMLFQAPLLAATSLPPPPAGGATMCSRQSLCLPPRRPARRTVPGLQVRPTEGEGGHQPLRSEQLPDHAYGQPVSRPGYRSYFNPRSGAHVGTLGHNSVVVGSSRPIWPRGRDPAGTRPGQPGRRADRRVPAVGGHRAGTGEAAAAYNPAAGPAAAVPPPHRAVTRPRLLLVDDWPPRRRRDEWLLHGRPGPRRRAMVRTARGASPSAARRGDFHPRRPDLAEGSFRATLTAHTLPPPPRRRQPAGSSACSSRGATTIWWAIPDSRTNSRAGPPATSTTRGRITRPAGSGLTRGSTAGASPGRVTSIRAGSCCRPAAG